MTELPTLTRGRFVRGLLATVLAGLIWAAIPVSAGAEPTTRTFTVVNVEYQGSKIWLPATLVVEKGDTVEIKLINNVPGDPNQHGFAIPAFNVSAVVTRGTPETVKFVASKAGIHDIKCQLHPAHVAGQLIVLGD